MKRSSVLSPWGIGPCRCRKRGGGRIKRCGGCHRSRGWGTPEAFLITWGGAQGGHADAKGAVGMLYEAGKKKKVGRKLEKEKQGVEYGFQRGSEKRQRNC